MKQERDLTRIWAQNAARKWAVDFRDLTLENMGLSMRLSRFGGQAANMLANGKNSRDKAGDEVAMLSWLDQMTESCRRAYLAYQEEYERFMRETERTQNRLERHMHEHDQRLARLDYEEAHAGENIRLSDGRFVNREFDEETQRYRFKDNVTGLWIEGRAEQEAQYKYGNRIDDIHRRRRVEEEHYQRDRILSYDIESSRAAAAEAYRDIGRRARMGEDVERDALNGRASLPGTWAELDRRQRNLERSLEQDRARIALADFDQEIDLSDDVAIAENTRTVSYAGSGLQGRAISEQYNQASTGISSTYWEEGPALEKPQEMKP